MGVATCCYRRQEKPISQRMLRYQLDSYHMLHNAIFKKDGVCTSLIMMVASHASHVSLDKGVANYLLYESKMCNPVPCIRTHSSLETSAHSAQYSVYALHGSG